jgi:pyrophosphatase PpaX
MTADRTLLFDLDGTLVDTIPFIVAGARHTFEGYVRRPTDAEWIAGIGTPLRSQIEALAVRPEDVEPLLARYRAFWFENHDRLTKPFPGAVETIRLLSRRGHPIGIVTSKTMQGALRTLAHVGLSDSVGVVVAADSCAKQKPDPMPVRLALERLGGTSDGALMMGDSLHDILAGNAAGVLTIAALWGAGSREVLAAARPSHELADILELMPLLERLDLAERGRG